MYKKIAILALFTSSLASAGENHSRIWGALRYLNPMNYSFRGSVPKVASTNPGDYVGGFTANKAAEFMRDGKDVIDTLMKNPEAAEKAGKALTHGLVYGAVSAPFDAARDGIVYVKDAATAHPVIAGTVVTTSVAAAAYYKFRPLSEKEKQEQELAKAERLANLRAAHDVAAADDIATEFRTCLNRHAYDKDSSCADKIKRCHSPARRLSMLNRKRVEDIVSAFKEYS